MATFDPTQRRVPVPPGAILKEELEAREWTQRMLAEIIDRPEQLISAIIHGRKQITPRTSRELAAALDTSEEFWYNLETIYRFNLEQRRRLNIEAIHKRRARAVQVHA